MVLFLPTTATSFILLYLIFFLSTGTTYFHTTFLNGFHGWKSAAELVLETIFLFDNYIGIYFGTRYVVRSIWTSYALFQIHMICICNCHFWYPIWNYWCYSSMVVDIWSRWSNLKCNEYSIYLIHRIHRPLFLLCNIYV